MSQSDYLKYKKSAVVLRNSGDLPAVFDEQDYISFKRFSIGNSIVDTNKRFDQLVPTGTKILFDIERAKTSTCPTTFSLCNTNQRVNRVLNKNIVNSGAKTFPFVKPIGLYVKQPAYKKTACSCIQNSKLTDDKICSCKTKFY
jgi:hypothetical protein